MVTLKQNNLEGIVEFLKELCPDKLTDLIDPGEVKIEPSLVSYHLGMQSVIRILEIEMKKQEEYRK